MKKFQLIRLSIYSIILLIVLPCSALSQTIVNVAGWNLGGFSPIPPLKVKNHVRAINKINPYVMVLSEVNPNSVATDIATQLGGYKAAYLQQTSGNNIAIIYKNRSNVRVSNVQLIEGSDDGNSGLRKALAANVKIGRFDFILIGVHMKSGRPQSSLGAQDPQRIRTRQAQAISRFIEKAMVSGEKDVLIVGDYNMIPSQDNINFTEMSPGTGQNELLSYISDVLSWQPSHLSGCNGNQARGNFLDGFSISRIFTREYLPASIKIYTHENTNIFAGEDRTPYTCTTYKGFVSDHFPLVARFRINLPDDD